MPQAYVEPLPTLDITKMPSKKYHILRKPKRAAKEQASHEQMVTAARKQSQPREVTSALLAVWKGIRYLIEGESRLWKGIEIMKRESRLWRGRGRLFKPMTSRGRGAYRSLDRHQYSLLYCFAIESRTRAVICFKPMNERSPKGDPAERTRWRQLFLHASDAREITSSRTHGCTNARTGQNKAVDRNSVKPSHRYNVCPGQVHARRALASRPPARHRSLTLRVACGAEQWVVHEN
ncbi:hypothetical protein EVAR_80672_1 [Eumeta japonica]|uniref:Uncharacterized protein n=1 Tax=Eumeta variegata TaxID=151549 RepID=A0A4C1U3A0_EUMVA|nr:hypothetical protein EVAR_80672_1 [Eumeta japonica]